MSATLSIKDILIQVRGLNKDEQFTLLERLIVLVRKNEKVSERPSLLSISGVGSEIWKDTNIDQYIDQERQW